MERFMKTFPKAGILGAGSWGTALGALLAGEGCEVVLWGRDAAQVEKIRETGMNADYLPGASLPDRLQATASIEAACDAPLVLFVPPSAGMRGVCEKAAAAGLAEETVLLSCTKGIERESGKRMTEVMAEYFPRNPLAVLSGPSHAEEVIRQMPTAVVLGCSDGEFCEALQQRFSARWFRVYTSEDCVGIELGGALKNVFAIAAGISDGLGLGDNSKAALVTRSLSELIRLGVAMGGNRETFQGLSGIGDLMVTCFSRHSRNRSFGERVGRGELPEEVSASMHMIAEGVPTTRSSFECAQRLGVSTPIIEQVNEVLYRGRSPGEALRELLTRDLRPEPDRI
jgi:glycerol-3-phosphate dehydrogenase (NAD(P)+)